MYSLTTHGSFIADRRRMTAYARVIERTVRSGSVVVDLGTGSGIFALLACRAGARQVYAIEPDDVIQVARQLAAANGYADRIECIQARSTAVSLPERADVIISDLHGLLPLFERHLPVLADARRRFLAPGGVMLPRRDVIWAAVVEAPSLYGRIVQPWDANPWAFDLGVARKMVTNVMHASANADETEFLTAPAEWATVDYLTHDNANIAAPLTWNATRAGVGHGLIAWFDTELTDSVRFSASSAQSVGVYGSAFFPWSRPVEIAENDAVRTTLRGDLVGDGYVWGWDTTVADDRSDTVKARFVQSTLHGAPLSLARLHKQATTYVPALGDDGKLDRAVLELMDGKAAVDEIARIVASRFPGRFPTPAEAVSHVARLSRRYG